MMGGFQIRGNPSSEEIIWVVANNMKFLFTPIELSLNHFVKNLYGAYDFAKIVDLSKIAAILLGQKN